MQCSHVSLVYPLPPPQKESQKADEYLREIKDQKLLSEAVSQCIEAASYEHQPDIQKSLLRVSSQELTPVGGSGLPSGGQRSHRGRVREVHPRTPPTAACQLSCRQERRPC